MVRGLSPQQLLERLGLLSVDPPRITGAEAMHELDMDEDDDLVGVFSIDDWAVAFEPGAYLLGHRDRLTWLSASTPAWSATPAASIPRIRPFWLEERQGTAVTDLMDAMRAIGFRFIEDEGEENPIAKAFALAEHITGVPLTEGRFEKAVYLLGAVPN